MAGLHGESDALVPLEGSAGIVGRRTLATHHEQTMARPCASVVKASDKLTML